MDTVPESFERWLERAGKSPATVRAYGTAVGSLATDADPVPAVARACVVLSAQVSSGAVAPATANVRLAALRAYAAFLGAQGVGVPVPLRPFRRTQRPTPPLPPEALDRLLDAPLRFERSPVVQARDAALLGLLACVPIRTAAIAALTRADVPRLPLSNFARHWIRTYLARRRDSAAPLFLRHDRAAASALRALTPRTIERVVVRYAERAGIAGPVTPERMRATLRTAPR